MGGGVIQLKAYGAQDVYLTGNPQFTFFKEVYRRYTNFATDYVTQSIEGSPQFGMLSNCTIAKSGDLLDKLYVSITLPELYAKSANKVDESSNLQMQQLLSEQSADDSGLLNINNDNNDNNRYVAWVKNIGFNLFESIEIFIGQTLIDKQYGEWMFIWSSLVDDRECVSDMIGNQFTNLNVDHHTSEFVLSSENEPLQSFQNYIPETKIIVPLQFWFCRNPGLALPLHALEYSDIRLQFRLKNLKDLIVGYENLEIIPKLGDSSMEVIGRYFHLEDSERQLFANSEHEYLITQLQYNGPDTMYVSEPNMKKSIELNFNNSCKELIWVCQRKEAVSLEFSNLDLSHAHHDWNNYVTRNREVSLVNDVSMNVRGKNPVKKCGIRLNNINLFPPQDSEFYSKLQISSHHSNHNVGSGINVYSFALYPEDYQPSGSCNFSKLEQVTLDLTFQDPVYDYDDNKKMMANTYEIRVYALSYNVLRIKGGQAGVEYI